MKIGTSRGGDAVELNLAGVVGMNGLIIAAPGGGKSGLLRKVLEQTYGRLPHVVFDPDDEFFTLREQHEYLVVGGDTGDAPAEVSNAAALARMVVDHQVSLVIQMNHLKDEDPQVFADIFLRELMETPRAKWRPMIVAIDEAQRFVPEGGVNESSAAVRDAMSRGRKRGMSVWLASQRISYVAKDVTEICQNLFLGISGLGNDLDRSTKMLGMTRRSADGQTFTSMPPRTFWTYGPATTRTPQQFYVDDTDTTIPQVGQPTPPTPPAPEAMRGLLEALRTAATAPSPTAPADAAAPAQALSQAERDAISSEARQQGYVDGHAAGIRVGVGSAIGELRPLIRRLEEQAYGDDVPEVFTVPQVDAETADRLRAMVGTPPAGPTARATFVPDVDRLEVLDAAEPEPAPGEIIGFSLTPAHQKILNAIAFMERLRRAPGSGVDKATVAFLAQVSSVSSGYRNNLGRLRTEGFIRYPAGNQVALTDLGRHCAVAPKRITDREVQNAVMDRLTPALRGLLEVLLEHHPKDIAKPELAARAGVSETSSGFRNNLGRLRSLDLITYPAGGRARASDLLFPESLR